MNIRDLPKIIVSSVIMLILALSVLVPIIDSTTTDVKIFTNDGYYRMSEYGPDVNINLVWEYTTPNKISVNDEIYDIPTGGPYSVIASNIAVRSDGRTYCQITSDTATLRASVSEGSRLEVSFASGSMTGVEYVNNESSGEIVKTYSKIYVIDDKGDYVMKKSTEKAYMLGESPFFGCGMTDILGNNTMLNVEGSISQGATVTQITTSNPLEYDDIVIDSTPLNNYDGVFELGDITFNASNGDESQSVVYSYYIVPYKIYLDVEPVVSGVVATLLVMIPIFVVLGIALYIVTSRD